MKLTYPLAFHIANCVAAAGYKPKHQSCKSFLIDALKHELEPYFTRTYIDKVVRGLNSRGERGCRRLLSSAFRFWGRSSYGSLTLTNQERLLINESAVPVLIPYIGRRLVEVGLLSEYNLRKERSKEIGYHEEFTHHVR